MSSNTTKFALGFFSAVMMFGLIVFLRAQAFNGPSSAAGVGSGAIAVGAPQNISIGTSTASSSVNLLIVGSTSDNTAYGLEILNSSLSPLLTVRNDGIVSVGTSTISGGSFAGTVSAGNISSGQFGSNTGAGNYSFPANLSIGTSTTSNALEVNGAIGLDGAGLITSNPSSTAINTVGWKECYYSYLYCLGLNTGEIYMKTGGYLAEGSGNPSSGGGTATGPDANSTVSLGSITSITPGLNGFRLNVNAGTFTDTNTASSSSAGALAINAFGTPTLKANNATITEPFASNVYIGGAPIASTHEAITNSIGLDVSSSAVTASTTNSFGIYAAAPTGATNNYVLGLAPSDATNADNISVSGNNVNNSADHWLCGYGCFIRDARDDGMDQSTVTAADLAFFAGTVTAVSSTQRMTIQASTGNVSIGTSTPNGTLEVFSSSSNFGTLTTLPGNSTYMGLYLDNTPNGTNYALAGNGSSLYVNAGGGGATTLASGGTAEMTVLASGNVGIGTTTPASTLQVKGTTSSTIEIGSAGVTSCLKMHAASGTIGATVWVYFDSHAVMYATTTQPSFCD